jgi:hypothetical protein
MRLIAIPLILLILPACFSKSKYVDTLAKKVTDNSYAIAENRKAINKIEPKVMDKGAVTDAIKSAIQAEDLSNKSSAVVSPEAVKAVAVTGAKAAGGYFGLPFGLIEGILALFGLGGAGYAVKKRAEATRERRRSAILADLDPAEAAKLRNFSDL